MYPRYAYPITAVLGLARDALSQHHRSFAGDARSCVSTLGPSLRVQGVEHIPSCPRYVITPNHYFRAGYASQWTALAISASVPNEIHWIMAGELTFPGKWYAPLVVPFYRFVLRRIGRTYGFTTMPPMPPRPRDVEARARSVRDVLRYIEHAADVILGLAPEGGDHPDGTLSIPPSGVGRFCLLLAEAGLRFLPVGVYERDGVLRLNFGQAYELQSHHGATPAETDRFAAFTVMQHIAGLVPPELRGDFC